MHFSTLKIGTLLPRHDQPRRSYEDSSLAELAADIKAHGVLQPLTVRPHANGKYEIVAGHRRHLAAQLAGLSELPCVVRDDMDNDARALEAALSENIQREDLPPIDEALVLREIMDRQELSVRRMASRIHKGKDYVQHRLDLLTLPAVVQAKVVRGDASSERGEITEGHARQLRRLRTGESQLEAYGKIVEGRLTTRQTETLITKMLGGKLRTPGGMVLDEARLKLRKVGRGFTARFINVRGKKDLIGQLDHLRAEVEALDI